MESDCQPLFGSTCYSGEHAYGQVVGSGVCAAQWSTAYNSSEPVTIGELADINQQAHEACAARTTQVRPPLPSGVSLFNQKVD